jgi:hypothetical protein
MTTSESAFINDIKEIAKREPTAEGRRKAAAGRFYQLERELEGKYQGLPNPDRHIERELADFRRAMLIELDKDQPVTVGTLLDSLIAMSRKRTG